MATLSDLTGEKLRLSDTFKGFNAFIEVGKGFTVDTGNILKILENDAIKLDRIPNLMYVGIGPEEDPQKAFYEFLGTHNGVKKVRVHFTHPVTTAERRLSKQLHGKTDMPHYEEAVAAICDVLYGHSLDEEAAKRAGEGASPQKRGRVTRVLAGEILDYMRKAAAKLED